MNAGWRLASNSQSFLPEAVDCFWVHGIHPKVVTRGPKNLRPTPGWRPVELPTQTSQLEETVDEAFVVQVQEIPTVDLDDLRPSSIKTPEST